MALKGLRLRVENIANLEEHLAALKMSYTCCLLLTILVILPSWFGKYIYARIKCFSCWFLIKSYFFISFSSSISFFMVLNYGVSSINLKVSTDDRHLNPLYLCCCFLLLFFQKKCFIQSVLFYSLCFSHSLFITKFLKKHLKPFLYQSPSC